MGSLSESDAAATRRPSSETARRSKGIAVGHREFVGSDGEERRSLAVPRTVGQHQAAGVIGRVGVGDQDQPLVVEESPRAISPVQPAAGAFLEVPDPDAALLVEEQQELSVGRGTQLLNLPRWAGKPQAASSPWGLKGRNARPPEKSATPGPGRCR